MMKKTDNGTEQYLRRVKRQLHLPKKQRCSVLEQLRDSIAEYGQTHENPSVDELCERFGTPKQIYEEQLADSVISMDSKQIAKKWSTARKVKLWLIIVGAVIILGFLVAYIWMILYDASNVVTTIESDLSFSTIG